MSMDDPVSVGPTVASWVQFGFVFFATFVVDIRVVVSWLVAQLFDESCCDVGLSLQLLSESLVGFG